MEAKKDGSFSLFFCLPISLVFMLVKMTISSHLKPCLNESSSALVKNQCHQILLTRTTTVLENLLGRRQEEKGMEAEEKR